MKGLLFKEEMFRAAIEGRKVQTRRIVQSVKFGGVLIDVALNGKLIRKEETDCATFEIGKVTTFAGMQVCGFNWSIYPRYRTGETVYLKEPYFQFPYTKEIAYKYDNPGVNFNMVGGWKNKLFMPESAARYFIKITRVRCERLMDITEIDAIDEGVVGIGNSPKLAPEFYDQNGNWKTIDGGKPILGLTPRQQYERVWDSINVKWNRAHTDYRGLMFQDNPYVFVYEFELTEKLQ